MDSREAIKLSIGTADFVAMGYLADLTDQDLMLRPHPGCNHINWQIGHLVAAEHDLIEKVASGAMPALAGWLRGEVHERDGVFGRSREVRDEGRTAASRQRTTCRDAHGFEQGQRCRSRSGHGP